VLEQLSLWELLTKKPQVVKVFKFNCLDCERWISSSIQYGTKARETVICPVCGAINNLITRVDGDMTVYRLNEDV